MIANNDGWIEWTWTEEKPYPESLDTKVDIKYANGDVSLYETVGMSHSTTNEWSSWFPVGDNGDIVAYRVVN